MLYYIIMWILFGTNHNTVENEPYVYFVGIFDNVETAKKSKEYLIKLVKPKQQSDFFIREVKMNDMYTYDWSNCCDENDI